MKQFGERRASINRVGGTVNPLDFWVRSKNYAYLENIGHYKKFEYSVQIFKTLWEFQDQNTVTS